ncbi:DegT/DnrJ/EryC1/StrS family aminotransferase [Bacillus velezensis]
MTNEEIASVTETIQSGWISKGPKVIDFEKKLGECIGAEHVISCNSGTGCLTYGFIGARCGRRR